MVMFCPPKAWVHLARRYGFGGVRSCSGSGSKNGGKSSTSIANSSNGGNAESSISTYDEAYRQLDKLDFMTAAKILFAGPPKKKKFG